MRTEQGGEDSRRGGAGEPAVIGLFLVPDFPILSVAAAIDPLRQANRLAKGELYRWVLISQDGAPVRSSARIELPVDFAAAAAPPCELVIVCAGIDATRHANARISGWLRRLHRGGCRLGALSTGSYLLAEAGLLDGRRCAVHWENASEFRERYPKILMTHEIFSIDGPFITSSGGTVTLDMMLHLVAATHGRALAHAISDQFNHSTIRLNDEAQRMPPEARFGVTNAKLSELIRHMEASIDAPPDIAILADLVGLSRRHIERLFRVHLGQTPSDFYRHLRMARARTLVTRSSLALTDIARICGYESTAYFSRVYRQRFGLSPTSMRRQAATEMGPASRPFRSPDGVRSEIG